MQRCNSLVANSGKSKQTAGHEKPFDLVLAAEVDEHRFHKSQTNELTMKLQRL